MSIERLERVQVTSLEIVGVDSDGALAIKTNAVRKVDGSSLQLSLNMAYLEELTKATGLAAVAAELINLDCLMVTNHAGQEKLAITPFVGFNDMTTSNVLISS